MQNDQSLTATKLLARNIGFNLAGKIIPLSIAVVAVPMLVHGLGTDRFGVLTIIWVAIGYFNYFDLGLGRALTKLLSEKLASEKLFDPSPLIWTCLVLMAILSILVSALLFILSTSILKRGLNVPEILQNEAIGSFKVLAIIMPFVLVTGGFRAALEAYQRFGIINGMNLALGAYSYISPLLVLMFTKNLFVVVLVLSVGRFINWVAHLFVCLWVVPNFDVKVRFQKILCGRLMSFGGWVTVSSLISPVMEYFDRFIIGASLSMAAVAYYATTYDIVTRVAMIPMAICGVLFPAFSGHGNVQSTLTLFNRGVKAVFVAVFPILLILVIFAEPMLILWIGRDFAQNSERVLQLLAMGLLANSLALVPLFLIQGLNRPDIPAKIHLCELPLYLLVLWIMIVNYGIRGAALAWAMRTTADAIILFACIQRLMPNRPVYFIRTIFTFCTALCVLLLGFIFSGLVVRLVFVFVALGGFAFAAWFIFLAESERTKITILLKRWRLKAGMSL